MKRRILFASFAASLMAAFLMPVAASAAASIKYEKHPFTSSELSNWSLDRTTPSGGYASVNFGGRSKVLKLGVNTGNASSTPGFYRTEGLQRQITPGAVAISADLYVSSSWTNNKVRAGLWGVGHDAASAVSSYPIVEYTTMGDNNFTGWRWWNGDDGGWTNLPNVHVKYNKWNTLKIVYHTGSFDFYVNDDKVGTYTSPDTKNIGAVILNSFNPAEQGSNYDVHWSRFAIGYEKTHAEDEDECKDGSWKDFGQEYKNQGQCVKDVKSHDHDHSHDNWDD